jgi:RluA family pseudouridine synthase
LTDIPILWSDQDLLVIDKPAGMLSLPDGYDPSLPHVKSVLSPLYGDLWIVHRLDRETSGVMVLACNADAHQDMNTQFQNRMVKKVYVAIVLGCPEWDQKFVQLPLRTNVGRRHRTVVDRDSGKGSETQFNVLERFADYCLIEAKPGTGRRHQIRAHLFNEGYPIACDSLYGILQAGIEDQITSEKYTGVPMLERTALHASSIEFINPGDGKKNLVEAPLASDMQLVLKYLRS